MKPLSAASIFAAFVASVAIAQTAPQAPAQPPPTYSPPQQYPSQPAPPRDQNAAAKNPPNYGESDVNDCSSRMKANNPRLSAVEIRQYCQRDLNPSSPQD
jgi:hypothetical protein